MTLEKAYGNGGLPKPESMTETERDAIPDPSAGLIIYNTTTSQLNFYNGTEWRKVQTQAA